MGLRWAVRDGVIFPLTDPQEASEPGPWGWGWKCDCLQSHPGWATHNMAASRGHLRDRKSGASIEGQQNPQASVGLKVVFAVA